MAIFETNMEEILNKLNEINVKLDICCGNYDKATGNIQRVFRGQLGRNIHKKERRSTYQNVTEELLDFDKDLTDRLNSESEVDLALRMPESDIIVEGNGSAWTGLPLHKALLNILNTDPNYDLVKWTGRFVRSRETPVRTPAGSKAEADRNEAMIFAKEFREWFDNNNDLEGGWKGSKSKSKRTKKSKRKKKFKTKTEKKIKKKEKILKYSEY